MKITLKSNGKTTHFRTILGAYGRFIKLAEAGQPAAIYLDGIAAASHKDDTAAQELTWESGEILRDAIEAFRQEALDRGAKRLPF